MPPCPEDPGLRDLQVHGSIILCLPHVLTCLCAHPLCQGCIFLGLLYTQGN